MEGILGKQQYNLVQHPLQKAIQKTLLKGYKTNFLAPPTNYYLLFEVHN